MDARAIAVALDSRPRREGRGWRTRCPCHGGFSLSVADGRDGRLLVKCWGAGCAAEDIFEELRQLDLDDDWRAREDGVEYRDAQAKRLAWALQIWDRARPAPGRIEPYLGWRGIAITPPPALRFLPSCKHESGAILPAIIAKFVNVDEEFIGIQRIFLADDERRPAGVDPPKPTLGPIAGAAVRLAPFDPGKPLIVGEGIETVLSLMQLRELPGWAAGSTSGVKRLILPRAVRQVVIAVDNDANSAGERAARDAGERWFREGRRVHLAIPSTADSDWNDVLRGRCDG
jgi:hypothetical protein